MNTTETKTTSCFEQRLKRLEREVRVFRWATALLAVAAISIIVMGVESIDDDKAIGRFRQIDTGHLVIRDADGQMRGWLGIAEGGPRLIFFDQAGQQRMGIGMTRQGEPALAIFDPGQNERVVLGLMEGWPGLVMRDPQGKKRNALFAREDWSSLVFYDRRETKRTGIGIYGDASAVNLSDDRGKDRVGITTDRKGSSLSFFDIGGRQRAALGMVREDEPALAYFTHEGDLQAALSVINRAPTLNLYGTNKLEVAMTVMATNVPRVELFGFERKLIWSAP
ncbi:MAG: hypothetical protein WCO42_05790 [bacterium]